MTERDDFMALLPGYIELRRMYGERVTVLCVGEAGKHISIIGDGDGVETLAELRASLARFVGKIDAALAGEAHAQAIRSAPADSGDVMAAIHGRWRKKET